VAPPGASKIAVDQINILKSCGGSARESTLVKGYALNCTRASPAMPLAVRDAKIACIDFSLRKEKMSMGYQVVVQDTSKVSKQRQFVLG
jgi:T-complex protein 1 subunit alpha